MPREPTVSRRDRITPRRDYLAGPRSPVPCLWVQPAWHAGTNLPGMRLHSPMARATSAVWMATRQAPRILPIPLCLSFWCSRNKGEPVHRSDFGLDPLRFASRVETMERRLPAFVALPRHIRQQLVASGASPLFLPPRSRFSCGTREGK